MRQQALAYRETKPVQDALAGQKTKQARDAFLRDHASELDRFAASVTFFKARGIQKLPSVKALQTEIEALTAEKNAGYSQYQEMKRRARELQTVKGNIEQLLHGAPSRGKNEHDL